jgi:transcriptional regulator with XRE-family HTH domain
MSQKALGIAAGLDAFVASPRINQYERGKHTPSFQTLSLLAKVLGVPVAYFYADEDALARVLSVWPSLKRSDRDELVSLATLRAGSAGD